MKEYPLVSIIIPVYNREKIVRRALDSAVSQTYPNIEIIVCDNASTDNTWETLQNYMSKDKHIKCYRNQNNLGPVRNWFECLRYATGEYLKILWSDDEIDTRFLSVTVPILNDNNSIGFVYTKTKMITSEFERECYRFGQTGIYDTSDFVRECLLFGKKEIPLSPGCALFRIEDVRKNLRVNIPNDLNLDFSRYGAGNDLLLYLYACSDYNKFYFIDSSLSIFYGGSDSLSIGNKLEIYYLYAQYYFAKERGGESIKNDLFSKLRFSILSKVIKKESFKYNWKILLKALIGQIKSKIIN